MQTVYLAGPEVFLPAGRDLIDRKRALCEEFGFTPTRRHGEFSVTTRGDAYAVGVEIARRNEELMDEADLCIANLTPFRGVSADVGTVFELGYVLGQGKPAFGYTTDPRTYTERVVTELHPEAAVVEGRVTTRSGEMVEDHGMADNLMLEGALVRRGFVLHSAVTRPDQPWTDLTTFREVLALARDAVH